MNVVSLRSDLIEYLHTHKLSSKWRKVLMLIESNIKHPSLNVELMEPKWHGIYSFRIDRKYRALFFIRGNNVEVFQITNHYKK